MTRHDETDKDMTRHDETDERSRYSDKRSAFIASLTSVTSHDARVISIDKPRTRMKVDAVGYSE